MVSSNVGTTASGSIFLECYNLLLITTKKSPGHYTYIQRTHVKYATLVSVINDQFDCKVECSYWHFIKDLDRKFTYLMWNNFALPPPASWGLALKTVFHLIE